MVRRNQEERTSYNVLIGKNKDGEYIFLEEAFRHGDGFKGLTGNIFEFLTQYDLDKRIDDYDWEELWKEAVYHGNCKDSYRDWVEEVKSNGDAEMTVRDSSYCDEEWLKRAMQYINKTEETDYEYSDCRGGGRIFEHEMLSEDYYEYFIPDNLKTLRYLYYKYEEKDV